MQTRNSSRGAIPKNNSIRGRNNMHFPISPMRRIDSIGHRPQVVHSPITNPRDTQLSTLNDSKGADSSILKTNSSHSNGRNNRVIHSILILWMEILQ